jgi:hypothetical protein
MMPFMRTTINLDDDIARVAKSIAREQDTSLGAVLSDLARKGLHVGLVYQRRRKDDLPTFVVREDSPPITSDDVKRDEDGW